MTDERSAGELSVAAADELGRRFRDRVVAELGRATAQRGRAVVAVSGGSAAEQLLPALVGAPIDLDRLDLFWVDERAVPPDAPDSNFRLARAAWLDAASFPIARAHRLRGEEPDLDRAARAAEVELDAVLGGGGVIDVALVGVGPDGHVASLFPGHAALRERRRRFLPVFDSPKPPPRRLTMTLAAFAHVELLVVAAFGTEKAAVLAGVVPDAASSLPIARAARAARRVLWLLDPAAASALDP